MNEVELDELEIDAVAAMTDAEVRTSLRRFGLRPLAHLPPEIKRLRASARYPVGVTAETAVASEEAQDAAPVAAERDAARAGAGDAVWAWMRWHLHWLKSAWGFAAFRIAVGMSALALYVVVGFALGVRSAVLNPPDPPTADEPVTDLGDQRILLVNFTVAEELRIREAIKPLVTAKCIKSFDAAGLRSPLEVAMHEGVVIMPSSALFYYSPDRLGLFDGRIQMAYREEFASGRAQSGTIPARRNGVQLTVDGRPRIFLHDTAFAGESFIFGRLSLNDVLAHEFMHAGGQPSTPGSIFGHDLSGFEHYDEIMQACEQP